jgi:hypothetical protein
MNSIRLMVEKISPALRAVKPQTLFEYQKKRFNCQDSKGVYCVEGAVDNRLQKALKPHSSILVQGRADGFTDFFTLGVVPLPRILSQCSGG